MELEWERIMGEVECNLLEIQNAQGRVIHEQQYKNTYSFYLAIYTFLNIFEFQYSQKKFFDYQMQKIIFDLNERKLNLQ